jgi:hypothetical protein
MCSIVCGWENCTTQVDVQFYLSVLQVPICEILFSPQNNSYSNFRNYGFSTYYYQE